MIVNWVNSALIVNVSLEVVVYMQITNLVSLDIHINLRTQSAFRQFDLSRVISVPSS